MKQFILGTGVAVLTTMGAFGQQSKAKTATAKPKATIVKESTEKTVTNKAIVSAGSIDSFSYALGMNIANNLKSQGITMVNSASLNKGMNDIFNAKTTTLNDQQANMCIQQKLQAFAAKKNDAEKEKGKAFLEANKKRPGVITLPSGVQYEVVKKGDANSALPKLQDTVVANYAGTLTSGKEFDNSYKRGQPLTIPVAGVIKGWTEILQLMHIGDKWKVYIPSELGYGERGAGADIPGGATLVFEMELLGIKPAIGGSAIEAAPQK